MKKIKPQHPLIILLFSFLMIHSSYSQSTEQLIISSEGKYCKASITGYQQRFDTLIISLSAQWINDNKQSGLNTLIVCHSAPQADRLISLLSPYNIKPEKKK